MPGFAAALAPLVAGFTVKSLVIKLALNFAIMAVTKKLSRKKRPSGSTLASETSRKKFIVRSSTAPMRMIYGRDKVSGVLVYAAVTGTKKDIVHMVMFVAGHPCEAIDQFWLDDIQAGARDGNGNVTTGQFAGKVRIVEHLGAHAGPDADLVSEVAAWTDDHKGLGLTWVWLRLDMSDADKTFPGGLPTPRFVVRGKNDLYDPRTASSGYTDNAALCQLDYLRGGHGFGAPDSELDMVHFEAQANLCDEWAPAQDAIAISSADIGNPGTLHLAAAHNMRTGDTAQIAGTTGYTPDINGEHTITVVDADSFTIPVNVTATGTGGTSQHVERRYTCNGSFTRDRRMRDVMEDLLTASAGTIAPLRGLWRVHGAAAGVVTRPNLSESDIAGGVSIRPKPGRDNLFNAVRGVYVDPLRAYQDTDFPVVTNATYETQDGGERIYRDIELPFTQSVFAAQRLARIELDRARTGVIFEAPLKKAALDIAYWDVVAWDLDFMGWSGKEFRLLKFSLKPDGQIAGVFQGDDPTSYDDDPTTIALGAGEQTIDWTDPTVVAPPTGVTLESGTNHLRQGNDGTIVSVIHVEWTLSDDAYVQHYRIEYRRVGAAEWTPAHVTGPATTEADIVGVVDGADYQVRIRAENRLGFASDWVEPADHTVVGKTAPPADVTGFAAAPGTDGVVTASFQPVQDVDVVSGGGYEIRYLLGGTFDWGTATALTSGHVTESPVRVEFTASDDVYSFGIKAVDTSGNESVNADTVLGVTTTHPSNVDAPIDIVLSSGDATAYRKADGTVVSRLLVQWTDPTHASAETITIQIRRQGGAWEPAGTVDIDVGQAYVWDVEDGVTYEVRLRAVAKRGFVSTWSAIDAHIIEGSTAPPSDVQNFSVTAGADGSLTCTWDAVPDVSIKGGGGYQIRYQIGATFDWGPGINLHDGNLPGSPFRVEFNQGDETYSFGCRAINPTGILSDNVATALAVDTAHPSQVDAPTGLTLSSGDATAYVKSDGTVVSRIKVEWTDPVHAAAQAIGIQVLRPAGVWEPVGTAELGLGQAYVWDVEDGVGYSVRIRTRAFGYVSAWVTELNHVVIGKTAPPPDPGSLLVNTMPDGTREFRWSLPSLPKDLAGYLLRYQPGTGHAWGALTKQLSDEGTGMVLSSPYETAQLPAGTFTFGVAAVDTSGNVSGTPKVVEATLGDPPILGSLTQLDLVREGWSGQKISCSLGSVFGDLVGDTAAGQQWANMITWATHPNWIFASVSAWEYRHEDGAGGALIDLGFDGLFTPLLSLTTVNANVTVTYNYKTDAGAYSGWVGVTGPITARYIRIRIEVAVPDTGRASVINQAFFIAAAQPIEEVVNDLDTSTLGAPAGDFRVPITETYAVITAVQVIFQNTGGGWSYEVIDKDPSLGPRIKTYNATPALADATIDAVVRGL